MSEPVYARQLGLVLCHTCGHVCQAGEHHCPRCHSTVHARKPDSIARTWALLIAALIFYIPANLLPVMRTNMFGNASENTIMSGVIEFWHGGSWDIAVLIFFASVVVPCMKFLILGMLLGEDGPGGYAFDDVRFTSPGAATPVATAGDTGADNRFAVAAAVEAEGEINEQNVERVIRQVLERLGK